MFLIEIWQEVEARIPHCGTQCFKTSFIHSLGAGLQNDHVAIMKDIEEELTNIHQQAREQKSQTGLLSQSMSSSVDGPVSMETDRHPFAVVDRVDPGSPAAYGVSIDLKS